MPSPSDPLNRGPQRVPSGEEQDQDLLEAIDEISLPPRVAPEARKGAGSGSSIVQTLPSLNEPERNLLVMYFGLDGSEALPMQEIARKLGISREEASGIKDSALEKLRASARNRPRG